jgi:hypothetical protein
VVVVVVAVVVIPVVEEWETRERLAARSLAFVKRREACTIPKDVPISNHE